MPAVETIAAKSAAAAAAVAADATGC